jgi:phenylacetate-coenzyme A ligase PaaK-like adenylate-forming protein
MDTFVEKARESVDAVAAKMLTDPVAAFDASYARMHAIPRDRLEAIQLAGLKVRFSQLRDKIPMLRKLADEAEIDALETLEEVIPLLFTHTVYKS